MLCIYAHVGSSFEIVDRQTQHRCNRALIAHHQYPSLPILIAVAIKKKGGWVGEAMKKYLVDRGVPSQQIIFEPSGYTTIGETNTFISIMRQHHPQQPSPIIVVSTWYHLPRICWLWLVRGRLVKVAAAQQGASLIDIVLEPAKLLINLFLPFYDPIMLRH